MSEELKPSAPERIWVQLRPMPPGDLVGIASYTSEPDNGQPVYRYVLERSPSHDAAETAREMIEGFIVPKGYTAIGYDGQVTALVGEGIIKAITEFGERRYQEGVEAAAKVLCGFCEKGIAAVYESDAYRHHLVGNETPWVVCRANEVRSATAKGPTA